ncbi:MAG: multidrug effflux MFS transporter [Pelagimonas sp.]|jgi:DHA1 family bicyclomycin/chloramphenicol resistance-like MFS transporter|nr:multidrug effflux MFS transporter [Pelagimonas sp.]
MPKHPNRTEFIALIAMMFATIAFSIDAMLPALPEIQNEFRPENPNRVQLIVGSFLFGLGIGTLFTGPLSDAFGRKPVVMVGAGLYIGCSVAATLVPNLELLALTRVGQGLGAAAARVVAMAIVRDIYSGRAMAQIISFVMMIFTIFPAIAPSIGAGLLSLAGWRAIFWAFVLFSTVSTLWFWVRQPETLRVENRRPFRIATLMKDATETFSTPLVRLSTTVQALAYGMLFALISSIHPIYEHSFDLADSFHLWFAATALLAMSSGYVNASLVMRHGMRKMVTTMLTVSSGLSLIVLVALVLEPAPPAYFAIFFIWQTCMFFQAGIVMGNLNAMAMEHLGHIAGMAASLINAISTIVGVSISIPIGQMFNGTPLPLVAGCFLLGLLSLFLMRRLKRLEDAGQTSLETSV